jgi:thymidylate synthase
MGKVDKVYQDLLKDILENGAQKGDRTGTGTVSVFGRMIRFNMADGFPLLTTKKMFTKGIITELLWFLNGETNIKPLVEQGNMIWVGDAYKKYISDTDDFNILSVGFNDLYLFGAITGPISDGKFRQYTKQEFIDNIKHNKMFATTWGDLGPVYGQQWVNWSDTYEDEHCGIEFDSINQIQQVIDTLKNNPNSRRIMVNAWNVADIDKMTLPPCHYGFQLNTTELTEEERTELAKGKIVPLLGSKMDSYDEAGIPKHKLSLMWNQRSVDTFLGLPFNIASYAFLLHMIAQQVNMVPHELIGSLGDTHLYSNHLEQVNVQLDREPMELCTLELKKADNIFSYSYEDFKILNYSSHPAIKASLSN